MHTNIRTFVSFCVLPPLRCLLATQAEPVDPVVVLSYPVTLTKVRIIPCHFSPYSAFWTFVGFEEKKHARIGSKVAKSLETVTTDEEHFPQCFAADIDMNCYCFKKNVAFVNKKKIMQVSSI